MNTKNFAEKLDIEYSFVKEELQKINNINSKSNWIQTFLKKKFYPTNPNIEDICIEDIAHALSMQCRFSGHINEFYSVAQHSVYVSYICNSHLSGLLHDASEAYLVDIPKPLKVMNEFSEYRKIENKLQTMIYKKFDLPETELDNVKDADLKMLATEARDLFSGLHPEWKCPTNPLPFKIMPVGPKEAEKMFLDRFKELYE